MTVDRKFIPVEVVQFILEHRRQRLAKEVAIENETAAPHPAKNRSVTAKTHPVPRKLHQANGDTVDE